MLVPMIRLMACSCSCWFASRFSYLKWALCRVLDSGIIVVAALIQKRLAHTHDVSLRPTQYDSRAARSTKDSLFILQRTQDLSLKTGLPLCLLFLDWKMAFDKVGHKAMLIAFERLRVYRQGSKNIYSCFCWGRPRNLGIQMLRFVNFRDMRDVQASLFGA